MAEADITEERREVMRSATCEMDALVRLLPDLIPLEENQIHYAVRGICGRMLRLTSALLSGLDDDAVSDQELKRIVELCDISQG